MTSSRLPGRQYKQCAFCPNEFTDKPSALKKRTYCSHACQYAALSRKGSIEITCPTCGGGFVVRKHEQTERVHCSTECMARAYQTRMKGKANPNARHEKRVCPICDKRFQPLWRGSRYCSVPCAHEAKRKPRKPNPPRAKPALAPIGSRRRTPRETKPSGTRSPRTEPKRPSIPSAEREKTCPICEKVFLVKPHRFDERKHCSRPCAAQAARLRHLPKRDEATGQFLRQCCRCHQEYPHPNRESTHCPSCRYHSQKSRRKIKGCSVCGQEFSNPWRVTCSKECSVRWKSLYQQGEKAARWKGGATSATRRFRNSPAYAEWRTEVFSRDDYCCQLCHQRGGKLAAHHIIPFSESEELRLVVSNGITLCWPCHRSIKGKEAEYQTRFFKLTLRLF